MVVDEDFLCVFVADPVSVCIMRKGHGFWLETSGSHGAFVYLRSGQVDIPMGVSIRVRCKCLATRLTVAVEVTTANSE